MLSDESYFSHLLLGDGATIVPSPSREATDAVVPRRAGASGARETHAKANRDREIHGVMAVSKSRRDLLCIIFDTIV